MTMTSAVKTDAGAIVVPSYFAGKQWQQVLERDARADGQFVYAVKSTKIYCKPSCASRRPTRKTGELLPFPGAGRGGGVSGVQAVRAGARLRRRLIRRRARSLR